LCGINAVDRITVLRMPKRNAARGLAHRFIKENNPTGWFEALYAKAKGDARTIPWADLEPNPNLVTWIKHVKFDGAAKRALVIGCGLGDDAEYLAALGFHNVDAFDISKTAIAWCRKRYPNSKVNYYVDDLLQYKNGGRYEFILEAYTLQVLPRELHGKCIEVIARLLKDHGKLLVITRGKEEDDEPGLMPWPLTREELYGFEKYGITLVTFEDYYDNEQPPVRRFRALFEKRV
jgi:SAM-dependent methyltransferase